MSRISTSEMYQSAQAQLGRTREREAQSMEKAGSGKAMLRPSENPTAWVRSQDIKDQFEKREGIAKNAETANLILTATEGVLMAVQEYVQKAHEVAIASGDGVQMTAPGMEALLAEASGIYENTIQVLNTRSMNKTLLGGFKNSGPAFDSMGRYLGDGGKVEVEIGEGLKVSVNITGDRAILGSHNPAGVNIPMAFHTLIEGLREGNSDLVMESIGMFRGANDQLSEFRAEIGARMSEIGRVSSRGAQRAVSDEAAISTLEDADAIKTFSDLARDQNALKASISTTQKILSEDPGLALYK